MEFVAFALPPAANEDVCFPTASAMDCVIKLLLFVNLIVYKMVSQYTISFFFFSSRASPTAHGSSPARGRISAVAAGLRHSHSNARSELHLQPTPQLVATLDPVTH